MKKPAAHASRSGFVHVSQCIHQGWPACADQLRCQMNSVAIPNTSSVLTLMLRNSTGDTNLVTATSPEVYSVTLR